jgi:hypothetical protein
MKVVKYKTILCDISNVTEFDLYVKSNIYKDFERTPSHLYIDVCNLLNLDTIAKTNLIQSIKKIFSENNTIVSNRRVRYWLNRGYTESAAIDKVKIVQKMNSPRTVEYWKSRGYTQYDAGVKVSKIQTELGNINKLKSKEELRALSPRCVEYWQLKGYSIEESKRIITKQSASYHIEYWKRATDAQKDRQRMVGDKNGMYGKPPPAGSGNGYSGWYRGLFFRSLHELNYIVSVLERFNIQYKSAESDKYRIKYKSYDASIKTYAPDYIISNKYLVEIKPKSLWGSKLVQLKAMAAIEFCNSNNLIYKLIDPGKMNNDKLKRLVENGDVVFMKRYEKKIKEYLYI